ncbi:MAG: hypothetical protein LBL18_04115 [Bacteroidales bacterium]|jgi:hypothetical protein|nr:hypothetical protein [Bacteroidales bacterium]
MKSIFSALKFGSAKAIIIPSYSRADPYQNENFEKLAHLKREKKYEESLAFIDAIESKGTDELHKFWLYSKVNKERAIIYRKLGDKQIAKYYDVLSLFGSIISGVYYRTYDDELIKPCFDYINLRLYSNDIINNKVCEYAEWFKPLAYELISINKEIKQEIDDTYLDYDYKYANGWDLEIFMHKKNKRFNNIAQQIEHNMPHHFIDKSLFLQ